MGTLSASARNYAIDSYLKKFYHPPTCKPRNTKIKDGSQHNDCSLVSIQCSADNGESCMLSLNTIAVQMLSKIKNTEFFKVNVQSGSGDCLLSVSNAPRNFEEEKKY